MPQKPVAHSLTAALDYERMLVLAIELSNKTWVLSAQVPGLPRVKAKWTIEPNVEALSAAIEGYRERAKAVGRHVERAIAIYEVGWSGFWLARWLATRGIETHVVQPSSVPVDRRAKSDGIDAELLLRTLLAWLRGEPRVCSMVPVPAEDDEDARRCVREREELVAERAALVNRIDAVLATLGAATITRCYGTGVSVSAHCALRSVSRYHHMPMPRSAACSIAWILCALRLSRSSRSATQCSKKRPRTRLT
jgi:transposase